MISPHRVFQQSSNECVRCSVASLLGLNREDVPNFMEQPKNWFLALDEWLRDRKLSVEVFDKTLSPDSEFYLGVGDSEGETAHCVVMRNGQPWHNPSGFQITNWIQWLVIKPHEAKD